MCVRERERETEVIYLSQITKPCYIVTYYTQLALRKILLNCYAHNRPLTALPLWDSLPFAKVKVAAHHHLLQALNPMQDQHTHPNSHDITPVYCSYSSAPDHSAIKQF